NLGLETRMAPPETAHRAIGQVPEDHASLDAGIDPVEQLVEPGGEQARQQSRRHAEALSRLEQHTASLRTLPCHARLYEPEAAAGARRQVPAGRTTEKRSPPMLREAKRASRSSQPPSGPRSTNG